MVEVTSDGVDISLSVGMVSDAVLVSVDVLFVVSTCGTLFKVLVNKFTRSILIPSTKENDCAQSQIFQT